MLLFTRHIQAAYSVSGTVNMHGDWQYHIYLATVSTLDDFYGARAEHIVSTSTIQEDGSFLLQGDNLPAEFQYYRLYVIKEEQSEFNACLLIGGEEHSFLHLILNNESTVTIKADMAGYAPFGDYTITADGQNLLMKEVADLVYPSYQFHEMRFPSELRFSREKLNRDLFYFADTCQNTLASLAAIINTDFSTYFHTHTDQYSNLRQRLSADLPDHKYTEDYQRKLRYYGDERSSGTVRYWQMACLALVLLCLLLFWLLIRSWSRAAFENPQQLSSSKVGMSRQEEKILALIKQGMSNKEIAQELYIEVSTVKSHINKLYAKLGVKNRKEASSYITQ